MTVDPTPSRPSRLFTDLPLLVILQVLPPVTLSTLLENIQWVSFLALTVTPSLAIYGLLTTDWNTKTVVWSILYYFMTGLGITAGEFTLLLRHRKSGAKRWGREGPRALAEPAKIVVADPLL